MPKGGHRTYQQSISPTLAVVGGDPPGGMQVDVLTGNKKTVKVID